MVMIKTVYVDGKRIVVLDEHGNEIGSVALPPKPEHECEALLLRHIRKNLEQEDELTSEKLLHAAIKACNDILEDENISFDVKELARYYMGRFKEALNSC